jgi:bromodomain adjacent to zinc finger domain protein 1A
MILFLNAVIFFIFSRLTDEDRRKKLREERKERALAEKRKKVEEKMKEKAKLKEEKLRLAEFLKQWNRRREDLECEDLKVRRVYKEISC